MYDFRAHGIGDDADCRPGLGPPLASNPFAPAALTRALSDGED